jgi:hypothetical protein
MTNAPLEDRLRQVLDQAARQLDVPPPEWNGPSHRGRRRAGNALTLIGAGIVAVIVAVALTTSAGRRVTPASAPSLAALSPPPASLEPSLPAGARAYIDAARADAVAHNPVCRGFQGPDVTRGAPSRALTSSFEVLRRPPVVPPGLPRNHRMGSAGAQLYANQVRVARTFSGAIFYVVPAGNVTGQAGVPARCEGEQVAALQQRVSHVPSRRRAPILAAQRRYLNYLRYLALHAEGVCAGLVAPGIPGLEGGTTAGCATVADFERWGVLADADVVIDGRPTFWTVVPDGVASVTLSYATPAAPSQTASITVRPVNNLVVAIEPKAATFPSAVVLHAADGSVLKRIATTPSMPTLCGFGC